MANKQSQLMLGQVKLFSAYAHWYLHLHSETNQVKKTEKMYPFDMHKWLILEFFLLKYFERISVNVPENLYLPNRVIYGVTIDTDV